MQLIKYNYEQHIAILRFWVHIALFTILLNLSVGCTKLVKIPEPLNTITTTETFSNAATANSAIVAIYENMSFGDFASGFTTISAGMSADELIQFGNPANRFFANTLVANGGDSDPFWSAPYFNIYQASAIIEGVQASKTLSEGTKTALTGEAEFLRAFCYFYLVNFYGNLPLVLTTSYAENSLLPRTPKAQVYQQMISDLKYAQTSLAADYSISNGERTRANAWAATALLARVYLYTGAWDSAVVQATAVINNASLFGLDSLNNVFLKNSSEAILQLFQTYNSGSNSYSTAEGYNFIPYDSTSSPNYYLTPQLLAAFEQGDARRVNWVDSSDYNDGTTSTYYYYPFKYKVATTTANSITEYPMVLRLAEQYLIRAEAEAELGGGQIPLAIADLNIIRARADLPGGQDPVSVLNAIYHERQVELFAEFGHRWFDLIRTNRADSVLAPIKPQWKPTAILYPIPFSETQTDPNLTQNPGY